MPIKILMPALSPTMTEGNLSKWSKKEGDIVKAGDVIAEIETDKATMEVEAVDEGKLIKILVPTGTEGVPVNSLIAVLIEEDEDESSIEDFIKEAVKAQTVQAKPLEVKTELTKQIETVETITPNPVANFAKIERSRSNGRIFASPLAKRIAASEGVDLSDISGTGPHGRIIKSDVLSANLSTGGKIRRNSQEYKLLPNNNMRKVIAKRLVQSKQTVPHFYLSIECNLENIIANRASINESFSSDSTKKLSVNDFIIMASAYALREVPAANASWSDDAIILYNNIDISVAVAIDGGLITPVLKNADQKSILAISSEMQMLVKRAKENKLAPEEYQGGGFSISNLGMYGIKNFSAIINPPQGCILAVGQGSRRAIVDGDAIKIATIMDVTLSCDHRVVDGAVGAMFLAAFKKYIESPILMFVA
jgi:pyruvate dehydrogenase E2 component (dihydrolipoamide acetyltransferase)